MTESLEENNHPKEKIKMLNPKNISSSFISSSTVSMKFHLKNGITITEVAHVSPDDFEEFKNSVISQLSKESNRWFYFLENDEPHQSALIRIDDISCVEIVHHIEEVL